MNTQFFKYALEVERTCSITQAAENLLIAQPNLSKAIREAEDSLGYAIFERSPRGVVPTEAGTRFLSCARSIVEQLRRMEDAAPKSDAGAARLSLSAAQGSYISRAISRLALEYGQGAKLELSVLRQGLSPTVADVSDGRVCLGVVRYAAAHEGYLLERLAKKGLRAETVWRFGRVALMSQEHPLASEAEITPALLENYIEIIPSGDDAPHPTGDGEGRPSRRILAPDRGDQTELLRSIPGAFMWASPEKDDALAALGLIQRRCEGIRSAFCDALIYRRDHALTPCERRFIDLVYEARNEIAL